MLKRANISLALAALPGLFAYSGIFETMVPAATIFFFLLLGFSVLSFLLALFEDEPAVAAPITQRPIAVWETPEVARVAP